MPILSYRRGDSNTILAPMSISERIREAREVKGLSQADLAATVGVSRGACGHWEQGKTVPSVEHLAGVATVLGVRFEWLATGRGRRDYDPAVGEEHSVSWGPSVPAVSQEERELIAVLARLPPVSRLRLVEFLRSIP
ncbi:hypothetical protein THSYN_03185 [Candidatus Thiodictyon syntrophicum]|uniref:HTH cro/C1-type domain-containing protein n=2 Tax=Candidatus Thiodictyon syntrophicum TaxID=1166950 RepID=A0A2K8U3F5_9GAMM|nr:hypothetical protein THSYN_03185 [Candidatus Thiodictyon syntrophicum]